MKLTLMILSLILTNANGQPGMRAKTHKPSASPTTSSSPSQMPSIVPTTAWEDGRKNKKLVNKRGIKNASTVGTLN
jgi:hypothetical protein